MTRHLSLRHGAGALAALSLLSVSACSGSPETATVDAAGVTTGEDAGGSAPSATADPSGVFDPTTVHDFSLEIDEADYAEMMETYTSTGDKEWISGTVTIDGHVFENVGLKLKGNSSLRGATADTAPETLPWRIELDEFVDGQNLDGYADFVVRANNSETSLNEAVALDLLEAAGLASEHAVSARFTVNGSGAELRLVLQNLDGDWDEENFGTEGILYKADADGDYSYRGDDPEDYGAAFDIDAGEDDYTPLMEFLDFVNNSSDEEFADGLGERLDIESFARYLAFEDIIGNFDDIDGPGNNSYLRWDKATGAMTVVAWDHNLAFGAIGGGPGQRGQLPEGFEPPVDGEFPEGFEPPVDGEFPEGFEPPARGPGTDSESATQDAPDEQARPGGGGGFPGCGGFPGGGSNILVERFQENEEFAALYEQAKQDLQSELVDSGLAQDILASWSGVLTEQASDLVDAETVESEASQILSVLSGDAGTTDEDSATSGGS